MDAAQYRSALQLLGWSQEDMAQRSGLEASILERIERGQTGSDSPESETARRTLQAAGVILEDGTARLRGGERDEGVRLDQLNTENDR